jgi:hypothetical protein
MSRRAWIFGCALAALWWAVVAITVWRATHRRPTVEQRTEAASKTALGPGSSLTAGEAWLAASKAAELLNSFHRDRPPLEQGKLTGRSMMPATGSAAWAIWEICDFADLHAGDFVIYETPAGRVAHRLIAKRGGGWIVQGDNNPQPDAGWVTARNFRGRIIAVFYMREDGK